LSLFGAFIVVGVGGILQGQAQRTDIYSSMVGDWVGYVETAQNAVVKHLPVEIVITELKDKDAVRMDYTYSRPGEQDFETISRFMKLRPLRSEMILRDTGLFAGNTKYKAIGLDDFARTGLGSFTATGPFGPGGTPGLFSFELSRDTLSYRWALKRKGSTLVPITALTLHRAGVIPAEH
jgi:hypothetical protein